MRLFQAIEHELLRQHGHLFPWAPVLYGTGIGVYFAIRFEPLREHWTLLGIGLILTFGFAVRTHGVARVVALALALMLAGFAVAGAKAHRVAGETLGYRYYGAI